MSNKEIVQQGLNVRKDVRAAEARAEKFREDLAAANDARFYDQMAWKAQRAAWHREQELLAGVVQRQRNTILQLREEIAVLHQRERLLQRRRILFSIMKAAAVFGLTIWALRLGWVAPNLATSLLIGSAVYVTYAFAKLAPKK